MCWTPSHVGLVDNERADLLAKAAVMNQNTDLVIKPEMTELKERVDDFILSKWQSRWREEKTGLDANTSIWNQEFQIRLSTTTREDSKKSLSHD